jgi:hypothetical protein
MNYLGKGVFGGKIYDIVEADGKLSVVNPSEIPEMETVSMRIPPTLKQAVDKIAEAEGRTFASQVRHVLTKWLADRGGEK